MFNTDTFRELFPNCKDPEGWMDVMVDTLHEYKITSSKRVAAFIAQCGHESGGWSRFSENLNYSAKALNLVFSKYFRRAGRDANLYHREPEKIANIVYANRMGNGPTESGDGWKYRGRGPIQLSGKSNYEDFSKFIRKDVVSNPDLVAQDKQIALLSAIWFWETHNLNEYADRGDIMGMTKVINGGYNGLSERKALYEKILNYIG